MACQGLSFRDLADRTKQVDPAGRGLSHGYLNGLTTGKAAIAKPAVLIDTILLLSEALDVTPGYFREYREHLAAERAVELAHRVGLDEVMAALDKLDDAGR